MANRRIRHGGEHVLGHGTYHGHDHGHIVVTTVWSKTVATVVAVVIAAVTAAATTGRKWKVFTLVCGYSRPRSVRMCKECCFG